MTTPYIGFGNNTLRKLPKAHEGDEVDCPDCGGKHKLECFESEGKKFDLLMFYVCGGRQFLGAVRGKLVIGQKADVAGTMSFPGVEEE